MKYLFSIISLLFLSFTSISSPCFADENNITPFPYSSPFQLKASIDIPVILASSTLALIPGLIGSQLPNGDGAVYNKDDINKFDRSTVGFYSTKSALASDIIVGILPLGAIGISLYSFRDNGRWHAVLEDFVLLTETLAVTTASMQIVKHAFTRPRPYMYQDDPHDNKRKHTDDDISSFYSGHSAIAFATAVSMSYMFQQRHKKSKAVIPIWIASLCGATSVALLRVFAGKHFFTDVITGSIIGASTGILVPALHKVTKKTELTILSGPSNLTLLVNF
jgi:membrane-associated phospholipid phosphatase